MSIDADMMAYRALLSQIINRGAWSAFPVNALPRFGDAGALDAESIVGLPIRAPHRAALYLHIPYCLSICRFCMLRRGAKASEGVPDAFVDALIFEMRLIADRYRPDLIGAVYVGGGTPSLLSPMQIERLFAGIRTIFRADQAEFTFEGEAQSLLRPGVLDAMQDSGVSRVSFGVQTFDEDIRALLGRTDSVADLWRLRERLHTMKFDEINVDLLYNLPGGPDVLRQDLATLAEYAPSSVDCHPLKYASCSYEMLSSIVLRHLPVPDGRERSEAFNYIREWMGHNQFNEQFVDQYCRPDAPTKSRYMQYLYGNDGGEYLGCGPGARSHVSDIGLSNMASFDEYYAALERGALPIRRAVRAPLADNYIACFPKRNDTLLRESVLSSSVPGYFLDVLGALTAAGLLEAPSGNEWRVSNVGLPRYQGLQELLLSPSQRANHTRSVRDRSSKLLRFGEYFAGLGTDLQEVEF